jgi:dihydroneopterin triphosphate diphosphatase
VALYGFDSVNQRYKIPESVLVVIYTRELKVLLLERADHPGFWQSVTGSKDTQQEPLRDTARREVFEETGIDTDQHALDDWQQAIEYRIYEQWRHRYAPGVTRNEEHWFGLCVTGDVTIAIAAREHLQYAWLDHIEAAKKCFSPSNAAAILQLPMRLHQP